MQTFLPLPSFANSMACLDRKRLGNQVYREGKTLLCGGWPNHPASKMWRGYEPALAQYCLAGLDELDARGYTYPTHRRFFSAYLDAHFWATGETEIVLPPWVGDESFHRSHQSNLLRKDPDWYGQFGWDVPDNLPYVWPKV